MLKIIIKENSKEFSRLDKYICHQTQIINRSQLKKIFTVQDIQIIRDDGTLESLKNLKNIPNIDTTIIIKLDSIQAEMTPENLIAQDINLDIIFEDQHILVINKKAGMVVHPAAGNRDGTLVNALLYYNNDFRKFNSIRPGIVHRLDKGTSGVMVIAKTEESYHKLVDIFSKHAIIRKYQALHLNTSIARDGNIKSFIARSKHNRKKMFSYDNSDEGKFSHTEYEVINYFNNFAHSLLTIHTGRTHQIRVHFSQILHAPLLMDPLYASPSSQLKKMSKKVQNTIKNYPHPFLHAKILGFNHPITGVPMLFDVPPPLIWKVLFSVVKAKDY